MEHNGIFDEERIDINMSDEGKSYSEGFDDGVKAVLQDLIGHTMEDNDEGCSWTWTIRKEDLQFIADKYGVKLDE